MIVGESVTVLSRQKTGVDALNSPVYGWVSEGDVENVLVAPGSTADVDGSIRPDGVKVVFQLHWPKADSRLLAGKRVVVRGETFAVIGDPRPYTDGNTPGEWNRPVNVGKVTG
jgi:hypothetical protein